jgi:hypothetical protein
MGEAANQWVPLSVRESGVVDDFRVPSEGVPPWLGESLWDWLRMTFPHGFSDEEKAQLYLALRRAERRLRRPLGLGSWDSEWDHVRRNVDAETLLDLVDYAAAHVADDIDLKRLNSTLVGAGSVWRVSTTDRPHLERVVPPEVRERAEAAMKPADRASEHLTHAWSAVYGRNPNPQYAYDQCVKAVEVVAGPVVSPANKRATLGTMMRDLRAKPDKWSVGLNHPDKAQQVRTVADMMDLMWKGQHRHGSSDDSAKAGNTGEEAARALQLAMTLVEWFRTGLVRGA